MSKTPQTNKEFIDYRFDETNENIAEVKKTLDDVKSQLNSTFATKDYVISGNKDFNERISSLESDRTWGIRALLGAIVTAVVYAYIQVKGK